MANPLPRFQSTLLSEITALRLFLETLPSSLLALLLPALSSLPASYLFGLRDSGNILRLLRFNLRSLYGYLLTPKNTEAPLEPDCTTQQCLYKSLSFGLGACLALAQSTNPISPASAAPVSSSLPK